MHTAVRLLLVGEKRTRKRRTETMQDRPGLRSQAEHLPADTGNGLLALWRNLALQDVLILSFQGYMCLRAWTAPPGPDLRPARLAATALLLLTVATLYLTRGAWLGPGFRRSITYRVGLFAPMVSSYFALRYCLAALQPHLLDARLYAIDRALFGDTPSMLLDRFVTPVTVEWFAFFYYGYFFLVATYLVGTLIFDAGRRHYELLLATAIVVACGHTLYTIVPGIGPHDYCAKMFHHALVGGVWWGRVERAVHSGGAMLDIFPSLHTALPVLFVLHSFRHREHAPFRRIWVVVALAVVNIVIATVFLRWHYGVDLIAGALLAVVAQRIAVFAWRFERNRDDDGTRQAVWERLAPVYMDRRDFNTVAALLLIHLAVLALAATASTS
jgi:hypothetical protein